MAAQSEKAVLDIGLDIGDQIISTIIMRVKGVIYKQTSEHFHSTIFRLFSSYFYVVLSTFPLWIKIISIFIYSKIANQRHISYKYSILRNYTGLLCDGR